MKQLLHSIKVVLFFAFLLMSVGVNAATYYVATSGNDNNNGSENSPWLTIQKAATAVRAGDHVYIKRGVYTQTLTLKNSGTADKPIVFEAYPGDEHLAILDCNSPGSQYGSLDGIVVKASYIRISGLKVRNATKGFFVDGPGLTNIEISNNHTYNTFASGIVVWGVRYQSDPKDYENVLNVKILNNKIEKACNGGYLECITVANGVVGIEIIGNEIWGSKDPDTKEGVNGGEGLDLKAGVRDAVVAHNYLHDLHRRGLYLDGAGDANMAQYKKPLLHNIKVHSNVVHDCEGQGMAIMTEGTGDVYNVDIYNNVFYRNTGGGLTYYKHPWGTGNVYDIRAYNNTMCHNGKNGILLNFPGSYGNTFYNNICYGNAQKAMDVPAGDYTESNNLFNIDPKFVNASAGDYHLTAGSPAINGGKSAGYTEVDFDGNTRNGAVDIGAFEFGGTSGEVKVTGVSVSPQAGTLNAVGATLQLSANVEPFAATNKQVSWESSNNNIATVSSTGLVTAVAEGTAIITVTTEDGEKTASSTIKVEIGTPGNDAIIAHTLPASINADGSVIFTVDYETTSDRDIHVSLQSTSPDYSGFGNAVKTVNGKGTTSITFTPANNPTSDRTYRWMIYMTEKGKNYQFTIDGTWSEQVVEVIDNNIPTQIVRANDLGLLCAPNPFNDFVAIQADKTIKSIKIYNTTGSLMLQENLNSANSSINTASFLSGIYLITVEFEDGAKTSMKISK